MRNVVSNNFGYVTVEFAYSAGVGYAVAYTGRTTEQLWMPVVYFSGCKSRDEAELKALDFLVNGDPRKAEFTEQGIRVYRGLTKNARVQLIGFDAFEKGVYQKHVKNAEAWKTVLGYFAKGKDGLKFDLIRINDSFSKAIANAKTYGWTALNREANATSFAATVNKTKKAAKARKAAVAKVEANVRAAATTAPVAKAERSCSALAAKVDAAIKAAETGVTLDDVMEAIA